MIPVITFEMVWKFAFGEFNTWLPWAQNWMVSLTAVDWQNFTEIMHDQWVVDVAGTGLEWSIVWEFIEAFFSTIGAAIGLFVWWFIAHLIWPWLSFGMLGILSPLGAMTLYGMYLVTIYFLAPVVFIRTIDPLKTGKWASKILYYGIWIAYSFLLMTQTPEIILIHPGWYLLITVLIAIYQDDK